jgi:hypothetical protein
MFQTGKMQQVGNSNDIGILLLRQGNKPTDGLYVLMLLFSTGWDAMRSRR